MGAILGAARTSVVSMLTMRVAGVLQLFQSQVEKDGGVGVFPARIAGREKAANISRGHGAQQRVGNGVEQHVAVRVAGQSLGMINRHAAKAQGHTGLEFVRVVAKSDACVHHCRDAPRKSE